MTIWNSLLGWLPLFTSDDAYSSDTGVSAFDDHGCNINPANGLPMVGGCGGVDIEGNPYGTDFNHDDSWTSASSGFEDGFASSSSWDNGMGSHWDD